MKKHILNDICVFNEHKYELRSISNSIVIKMTAMRAKCLSFIIAHAKDEIIERQELTTELWGERSKYVSDANLTQIIYLIRKDLKTLGINDFLITIPRRGIQVNNLIPIETVEIELSKKTRHSINFYTLIKLIVFLCSLLAIIFYLYID